jgi:FtsH-binding integral membrane protein
MALGLALTAGIAYFVASIPGFTQRLFSNPWLIFGIFIGQLALVIVLGLYVLRMSYFMAIACFLLYAASLGVTLSSIFLVYKLGSIYLTFLITAAMFGIMCIYGYFTKADLTAIGSLSMMALFGLIIAMIVNMFLKSSTMDYVISIIGVIVFTLLTAYDSQRIKSMAQQLIAHQEIMAKVAIIGALTLYLDFINLFLFLLNFFGKRQD